jgi:hypothetical protein
MLSSTICTAMYPPGFNSFHVQARPGEIEVIPDAETGTA